MTHIFLIRHGNYIEDLHENDFDSGLSQEGVDQAERLRDRLAKTQEIKSDVIISSPLKRAHETAEILAPALGKPVELDTEIEEWRSNDGSLSPEEFLKKWKEISDKKKAYYRWTKRGETRMEFSLRVHQTLNKIFEENEGKTIVLFTHGAFIQVSFNFFFGYGEAVLERAVPEIYNTSITHWYKNDENSRWILERSNDSSHLLKYQ